jgi:hypothetical protein
MFSFKINNIPTLFIKGFTAADVQAILDFVRDAHSHSSHGSNTVLFIDTPATGATVEAIVKLVAEGFRVVYRDHHGFDGEVLDDPDKQRSTATAKLRSVLGDDCTLTVRRLHPACSTLVEVGEFQEAMAMVADPDADGLTAAMKASGIFYEGLDDDAAKLDGEPALQVTGTELSQLLVKGIVTLPSFDPKRPEAREKATQKLFSQWVAVVQGDARAREALQAGVVAYEDAVRVSMELIPNARAVAPGVMLVDVVDSPIFDVGTLNAQLEKMPDCRVTVLRKEHGPIASLHGVQYSLAVAKEFQDRIDLRDLLAPGMKSDPQSGVVINVSFLLHVSEDVWESQVLPALRSEQGALSGEA